MMYKAEVLALTNFVDISMPHCMIQYNLQDVPMEKS